MESAVHWTKNHQSNLTLTAKRERKRTQLRSKHSRVSNVQWQCDRIRPRFVELTETMRNFQIRGMSVDVCATTTQPKHHRQMLTTEGNAHWPHQCLDTLCVCVQWHDLPFSRPKWTVISAVDPNQTEQKNRYKHSECLHWSRCVLLHAWKKTNCFICIFWWALQMNSDSVLFFVHCRCCDGLKNATKKCAADCEKWICM